jgi:hypothetical protein
MYFVTKIDWQWPNDVLHRIKNGLKLEHEGKIAIATLYS